jgi:hypothetical protein
VAPLRRWIAYVWPAIALGPVGEALALPLSMQLASFKGAISPLTSSLAVSVSVLTGGSAVSGAPERTAPAPAGPKPSHSAPSGHLAPHEGGMSLFLTVMTVMATLIGVVALARLTVGEDLFSRRWLH